MKRETQTIEIKQPWYGGGLKWIYDFAIAQGGMDDDRITACITDELEWRPK